MALRRIMCAPPQILRSRARRCFPPANHGRSRGRYAGPPRVIPSNRKMVPQQTNERRWVRRTKKGGNNKNGAEATDGLHTVAVDGGDDGAIGGDAVVPTLPTPHG